MATQFDFWVCDFETTTPKSEYYKRTGDVCVCLAGATHAIYNDREELKTKFVVSTNFIGLLDEIVANDRRKKIRLYFHNLGQFDGSYIIDELAKYGYNLEPLRKGYKENTLDYFVADNANVYSLKFIYKGRSIEIHDSLKLLTLSIADLGRSQGLEKLDNKYEFEPLPLEQFSKEDIDYLERDTVIPIMPLINLFKTFKNPKMTAGSTSVRGLFDWIDENSPDGKETKRLFDNLTKTPYKHALEMLPWCFGGLTFYNRLHQYEVIKGVYCYDANSFYPTQMTKPMIISSTYEKVDINYKAKDDEVILLELMVFKAKLKGPKDFFFLRNFAIQNARMNGDQTPLMVNRYVDEVNEPTYMWFFECEFEALKQWYDFDYEIVRKHKYETTDYMADYIQMLYDQRKELKAQKNPREQTVKTALNSTFGKFMENPIKYRLLYIPKGEGEIHKRFNDFRIIKRKCESFDVGNYEAWIGIDAEQSKTVLVRNPIIGAYITALARTELMKLVYEYRDYVVYGDTDSIFLTCKIDRFENTPNELGNWKNEYPDDKNGFNIYVYGRKRYICWTKDRGDRTLKKARDRLVKIGMCGVDKKRFSKYIEANKVFTKKKLDALVNKRINNIKLKKDNVKGKRVLKDTHYEIRRNLD